MNTIGMLITTFKRNVTSHLRGCPSGKILTNYTSEESLINYTVQVCFPFSKRHQPVRSETIEARVLLLNLSEFIGYVDLTDFRDVSPKPSKDDDKPKCVGKF